MARTKRIKKETVTNYHLMSRISGRQFLLRDPRIKESLERELDRAAVFSGVKVFAHCIMDDHFHIVCRVGKSDDIVPESEVIERIAALKGNKFADDFARHLHDLHQAGKHTLADEKLDAWRRRMNDVSQFVKTFKELVNIAYKRDHEYCGSLWSGRFKSTIVEDGRYLATCIRYVELNPVRAKMVGAADEYRWSSAYRGKKSNMRCYLGTDPKKDGDEELAIGEERLMKRVVQIGAGKIFGSREFVQAVIYAKGECFAGRTSAAEVVGIAYSSHGHRLANKNKKQVRSKAA